MVRIFIRRDIIYIHRKDPYEMTGSTGNEIALIRYCPRRQLTHEEVGILFDELCRVGVAAFPQKTCGADQRGNTCGKCRWRVSAGVLPSLLRRQRGVPNEITGSAFNEMVRIKVGQS